MRNRIMCAWMMTAAVALGACEGTLGLDASSTVSFAVPEGSNQVSSEGHTVVISQATMSLSSIALEGAAQTASSGSASVRLPVEGGVRTAARLAAEADVYGRVRMVVQSVRLVGTYDGAPFDVTVNGDGSATSTVLFPPLTVGANGGGNATIRVDVGEWFRSESGGLLTPVQLSTDATVRARLISNIGASLSAFADMDVNGSAG